MTLGAFYDQNSEFRKQNAEFRKQNAEFVAQGALLKNAHQTITARAPTGPLSGAKAAASGAMTGTANLASN